MSLVALELKLNRHLVELQLLELQRLLLEVQSSVVVLALHHPSVVHQSLAAERPPVHQHSVLAHSEVVEALVKLDSLDLDQFSVKQLQLSVQVQHSAVKPLLAVPRPAFLVRALLAPVNRIVSLNNWDRSKAVEICLDQWLKILHKLLQLSREVFKEALSQVGAKIVFKKFQLIKKFLFKCFLKIQIKI